MSDPNAYDTRMYESQVLGLEEGCTEADLDAQHAHIADDAGLASAVDMALPDGRPVFSDRPRPERQRLRPMAPLRASSNSTGLSDRLGLRPRGWSRSGFSPSANATSDEEVQMLPTFSRPSRSVTSPLPPMPQQPATPPSISGVRKSAPSTRRTSLTKLSAEVSMQNVLRKWFNVMRLRGDGVDVAIILFH